jgi:hypothetical protein
MVGSLPLHALPIRSPAVEGREKDRSMPVAAWVEVAIARHSFCLGASPEAALWSFTRSVTVRQ